MSRSDELVTRLDIRFPKSMYDRLQKMAIDDGAKIHHISKKAEVSPTIIKLIQFALDNYDRILSDNNANLADNLSDNSTNTTIDSLSDRVNILSDKLSDKMIEAIVDKRLEELGVLANLQSQDNFVPDNIDIIPDNIEAISDNVNNVPDSIPDSIEAISDNIEVVTDNIPDNIDNVPDTKNILSDNSTSSRPPQKNVEIVIAKFNKYPDLRDRVASGVSQGLKGSALSSWLFDGGFLNSKNKRYDLTAASNFKSAIEWIAKAK